MLNRSDSLYIGAEEVAAACSVSKAKAYLIIRDENRKLQERGFLTIAGRRPRRYFESLIADERSLPHDKEKALPQG